MSFLGIKIAGTNVDSIGVMLPPWKVDFLFLLLRLNVALRNLSRALTNSAASGF